MVKRFTKEQFIEGIKKVHGDTYDYSKTIYINAKTKIIIGCKIHGDFEQTPDNHRQGKGCRKCGSIKRSLDRTYTTKEYVIRATEVHGYEYNYGKTIYESWQKKIIIGCPKHGDFKQTPSSHLSGTGCPKCAGNKKLTTEEFIIEANEVHNNYYIYPLTIYNGAHKKVIITCREHGNFKQTPSSHLSGNGCKECGKKKISKRLALTQEQFLEIIKEVHGDTYDNSLIEYKGYRAKIKIGCRKHGIFEQEAGAHRQGQGCPICGKNKAIQNNTHTKEQFTSEADEVHDKNYDYNLTDYKKARIKVKITCKIHGVFEQTPNSHLQGRRCPKCASESQIGTMTYTGWQKAGENSKNFDSFKVYIIKCWNEEEEFYKIGKTYVDLINRFKTKLLMPYNYEVIQIVEGEAREMSELENKLQKENKEHKYIPKIKFSGRHECYNKINQWLNKKT